MTSNVLHRWIRWFFADKQGRIVIWQMPNAPLMVWLASVLAGFVVKTGRAHTVISAIGTVAIVLWAILEVISGASKFRRVLGGVVLVASAISYIKL